MTEEDEEFQRLEREAKIRALEDDDIQDYKKPWVGLTEEEIFEIMDKANTRYQAVQMTETILKKRNT